MQLSRTQKLFFLGVLAGMLAFGATAMLAPSDSVPVNNGVPLTHPDGATVKVWGETNMSLSDPFNSASEAGPDGVNITSEAGNITVYSSGDTHTELYTANMTGEWTNATNVTAGGTWIEYYPEDKQRFDIRGDVNEFSLRQNVALDDGTPDLYYAGTDGGVVTARLHDVPANTQIAAVDTQTREILDVSTSNADGNVTLDMDASSHTVELQNGTDSVPPEQSNASPTGQVASSPSELSIDISDSDFPEDNVTTHIYFEGTQIHTEHVESNSTVTTSNFTADTLGETYTWTVKAQDEYGSWTNETYQFEIPGNMTLRNETQPSQIITGKNVTVTFYTSDGTQVLERSDDDNDGNISLEGLPDTEFVVTITSNDFYDRRVYIETLFAQQNVYLLNSTAYDSATFTEFQLDDRTGEYPPDTTTLRVQRALDPDGDNESEWQTVAGDFFGATNRFPFTGQTQTRYRLVVENADGDRRILGSYTPTVGGVQSVPIGQVSFSGDNIDDGTTFQASLDNKDQGRFLTLKYLDLERDTENVTYRVVDASNESRVVIPNETLTDVEREAVVVHNMTDIDSQLDEDTGYKIEYWAERTNRADKSGHVFAGAVRQLDKLGIPQHILEYILWVVLIAWAGVTALANRKLSLISTPVVASAFAITGLMAIPSIFVALALVIGGLLYFGESSNVP